ARPPDPGRPGGAREAGEPRLRQDDGAPLGDRAQAPAVARGAPRGQAGGPGAARARVQPAARRAPVPRAAGGGRGSRRHEVAARGGGRARAV
ncbi:MAG: hypothetical protein AVDCRST_MAG40-331, partial [uncultured Gemmatimonadaceae bacterium]